MASVTRLALSTVLVVALQGCVRDFKTGLACRTDDDCLGLACEDHACAASHAAPVGFEVDPPTSLPVAGAQIALTIRAVTARGNTQLGYGGTATLTLPSDARATGAGSITFRAGVAVAPVTWRTAGQQRVEVADGLIGGAASIAVDAGPAASLDAPSLPLRLTQGTTLTVVVAARDAHGNLATGFADQVEVDTGDASDTGGGRAVHRFVAADGGTFAFPFVTGAAGARLVSVRDLDSSLLAPVYLPTVAVLLAPAAPAITAPGRVDPTASAPVAASVSARAGMTYTWGISGPGAFVNPHGTSGEAIGQTNAVAIAVTPSPGTVTLTCQEANALGVVGPVASATFPVACAPHFHWDAGSGTCPPDWPVGTHGDLVVGVGSTTTISAGAVRDYASINVAAGGTLKVAASAGDGGSAWTVIGCRGAFIVDGTIVVQPGEHTGGTFDGAAPAPDGTLTGEALRYVVRQMAGGVGGRGGQGWQAAGNTYAGGSGGDQLLGNGGGGGGGGQGAWTNNAQPGGIATSTASGTGGRGGGGTMATTAGVGLFGNRGVDGAWGPNDTNDNGPGGSGASGGTRGRHGGGLYLKAAGGISGTGTIDASGAPGGAGGMGGYGGNSYGIAAGGGGGGGGGGAGGSGGKIVIRTGGAVAPTLVVAGGTGGAAGPGFPLNSTGAATTGDAGTAGAAGEAGTTDVQAY